MRGGCHFPYYFKPQYFYIKFQYFVCFLFGIMRKILLHVRPNQYYHWTFRLLSHTVLASKEQKDRKFNEVNVSSLFS